MAVTRAACLNHQDALLSKATPSEGLSAAEALFLFPLPAMAGYIPHGPIGASPAMAQRKSESKKKPNNGANLGFEAQLWQMADKLRGNMDAADYKNVVLGLVFLKYISDAFQERYETLKKEPHADA